MGKVCSNCSVACLEAHPELQWWRKCPLCGFSTIKTDLTAADQILADKSPLMRLPDVAGIALLEEDQKKRRKYKP